MARTEPATKGDAGAAASVTDGTVDQSGAADATDATLDDQFLQ
ncbi:hypothetical protein PMN34_08920 [Bifidobacterium pseudocatenulatum]|nr:hypothetical protein [Bifidobacterium pseudocatenulatum]MDB6496099.1 hypothetical protein [Bifidobacterium pseudocatenulatum]